MSIPNLTSKTNPFSFETWTYGYNHLNQLITVQKKNASGQVQLDVAYGYDVHGNRTSKQVDLDGAGPQAATLELFAYDDLGNAWADLDAAGSLTTRRHYFDAVDALFARDTGGPGGVDWYLTDHLGSVRDIVNYAGTTVYTATYDAFGKIVSQGGSGGDRYKWTGREWDAEVSLQYNRARYYDPSTGRWISQDPIGFDAGDSNLYRYVRNRPTASTDPSGLDDEDERAAYRRLLGLGNQVQTNSVGPPIMDRMRPPTPPPLFTACTRCHAIHGFGRGERPWWIDDFGNITDGGAEAALRRWNAEWRFELVRAIPLVGGALQIGEGIGGQTILGTPMDPLDRGMRVVTGGMHFAPLFMKGQGSIPAETPNVRPIVPHNGGNPFAGGPPPNLWPIVRAAQQVPGTLQRDVGLVLNQQIVGGVPNGYAGHHLISIHLAEESVAMQRAAQLGYNINRGSNGMALPTTLAESQATRLPLHSGRHLTARHAGSADAFVQQRLNALDARVRAGTISEQELLTEISGIEDATREALRTNQVRLQANDPHWRPPQQGSGQ